MDGSWTLRLGSLAVAFETLAVVAVFAAAPWLSVWGTITLHVLSVGCCCGSAYRRTRNWRTEHSAVAVAALFVPLFGPCLGWMFPLRKDESLEVNAHAYFERFEEIAQGASVSMACLPEDSPFAASKINPMSFAEILRHGSVAHKRNALTKLAELGQPRHLRLLRSVMASETGELRLCAFLELRRVARQFEDPMAAIQAELDAGVDPEEETDRRVELAELRVDLARSGALDAEMERFHAERAAAEIEPIFQTRKWDPRVAKVRALVCLHLGRYEEALAGLAYLHEREQAESDVCLIRAEIGFHERNLERTRKERAALPADCEVPEWLSVLHPEADEAAAESVAGSPEEAGT